MNIKNVLAIDIIGDILIRPDALDTYLGEEVHFYLEQKINEIIEPTLIKLDLTKANPIDYLFTKAAFCTFFKRVKESDNLDAIFYIRKSQTRSLFWGLLACLDGNIHRNGNYEEDFKAAHHIKVCIAESTMDFMGLISDHETAILEYINEQGSIENDFVYDNFKNLIPKEKITDSIRNLSHKKFIYWDEELMPSKIYSITNKL